MIHEKGKLLIMAGPSLLENERMAFDVAEVLKRLGQKYAATLKVVFCSAFNKPHRTSALGGSAESLSAGLQILSEVKDRYGLPVCTEVFERQHIAPCSAVCDMLQIPSPLSGYLELMLEAARTGCGLNIRKGIHLSPADALGLVERVGQSHSAEVWLTERGTAFGYSDLVVDMRNFPVLKAAECPVLLDATLTSQLSGLGSARPQASLALNLAKAALAAGVEGLYLDVHPEPENALVDSATQLPLEKLEGFVDECLKVWTALR